MVKLNEAETEITEAELLKMIEDASQARLGIPASRMLEQYRKGELADPSSVADLIALAELLDKQVAA